MKTRLLTDNLLERFPPEDSKDVSECVESDKDFRFRRLKAGESRPRFSVACVRFNSCLSSTALPAWGEAKFV